jgi:hypothetical protein
MYFSFFALGFSLVLSGPIAASHRIDQVQSTVTKADAGLLFAANSLSERVAEAEDS